MYLGTRWCDTIKICIGNQSKIDLSSLIIDDRNTMIMAICWTRWIIINRQKLYLLGLFVCDMGNQIAWCIHRALKNISRDSLNRAFWKFSREDLMHPQDYETETHFSAILSNVFCVHKVKQKHCQLLSQYIIMNELVECFNGDHR